MIHVATLEDLAQLLEKLRRDSGYSYRVLSVKTGLSPGTLRGWEKGAHWPSMGGFATLLGFYSVTVTIGHNPEEEL